MRLALAQINSVVGDIDGNAAASSTGCGEAREADADLVLFPELVVTGYPPEDLLLRPGFVRAARRAIDEIARATEGITVARRCAASRRRPLQRLFRARGRRGAARIYHKRYLPNYGVFDEDRYFAPGNDLFLLRFGERVVGPTICEDIWQPGPPATDLALAGAQLIANISASPFHVGKDREREEMLRVRARDNSCFVALCNAVGGQDELIFDGHSVVLDDEGEVLARARRASRRSCWSSTSTRSQPSAGGSATCGAERSRASAARSSRTRSSSRRRASPRSQCRPRIVAPRSTTSSRCASRSSSGCATTCDKNGFGDVVIGLSGGIDSALTAALASRRSVPSACTASRCRRATRPGRRAATRGAWPSRSAIDFREIAIEPIVDAFTDVARSLVRRARRATSTEENLQARIRGTLLMALSNKFGWLVIATGNKSELSVGYSTLYGDLAGGFALIKDVYKTDVFRLSRAAERAGRPRADSGVDHRARAERRAARRPARRGLAAAVSRARPVLEAYVELDRSREELSQDGFDADVVDRARGADRPGRVQAPPGAAGREAAPEGVRPRPPHADHEPLAELTDGERIWFGCAESDSGPPQSTDAPGRRRGSAAPSSARSSATRPRRAAAVCAARGRRGSPPGDAGRARSCAGTRRRADRRRARPSSTGRSGMRCCAASRAQRARRRSALRRATLRTRAAANAGRAPSLLARAARPPASESPALRRRRAPSNRRTRCRRQADGP